jgi:short-subunit dehydrogenase
MASDCAQELKKENVAMVSVWPKNVKTEFCLENYKDFSQPFLFFPFS